eukprot:Phypoly_transcript_21518.p1 GENE.Phypoly_transcript_21518~~Phypoly_transcript_21518.p1  ORF type:complete len:123 (-),score=6.79 Phypoly_transcript_21518:184-552(-)
MGSRTFGPEERNHDLRLIFLDINFKKSRGLNYLPVTPQNCTKVVLSHSLSHHFFVHRISNHLPQIKRLIWNIVMNDMSGGKIEAENLKRPKKGVIYDLILIINVSFWNISKIVATSCHKHQT